MPSRAVTAEAAEMLRRLLGAVESGDLDAGSAQARALVRHLEGAAVAFEVAAQTRLPVRRKH